MGFRKIDIKSKDGPRGVPSWDKSGVGSQGTLPVKYAGVVNSVELERPIFREVMDLIKESGAHFVLDNMPDSPPAFIYRWPADDGNPKKHVFAVTVYPRNKPAQYFMILQRMNVKLRQIIDKVVKDAQKAKTTPSHPQPDWSNIRQSITPVSKPGYSPNSWGKGTHRGGSSAKPKGKDAPVSRAPAKAPSLEVRKAQRYSTHPWRRK